MNFGPLGNKKEAGDGGYFPCQSIAPFDGNFWEAVVFTSLSVGDPYDWVKSCEAMTGPAPFFI